MTDEIETLRDLYDAFNSRDIDRALAAMTDDVAWANAMEGGHAQGREAVRAYWTRQWSIVRPTVEPITLDRQPDGSIEVEVRQSVRDLDGNPLQGQKHGLDDRTVRHRFRFRDGAILRFDVLDETATKSP